MPNFIAFLATSVLVILCTISTVSAATEPGGSPVSGGSEPGSTLRPLAIASCDGTPAVLTGVPPAHTPAHRAPAESQKNWETTLKEGVDTLDSNRYWLAEPLLQKAVVEAASFGIEDLRLAKSYAELGRLYTVRGRFTDAEPLLEEELHIKQQKLEEEGEQLIPAMGSMIKFYLNYGTKSKADALTKEMLSIVEGKLNEPTSKPKSKITKVNGETVLEAWVGVASQTVRDPLIEWSITCDSVGAVYLAQKNFEMAERLFKAALEVKETVLGKTHLSLANSYDNLGGLALAQQKLLNAEGYLRDSYEMSAKILGKSNPQAYGRMDKLAKCLIQTGKRTEAEELYRSAQNLWQNAPSKSGDHIRACYALGNLYCEDKNYIAAEPLLKKAMVDAEEFHGSCSEFVVPYIQRYAYVLYYLGRKPESDELKAHAADITGNVLVAKNERNSTAH